VDKTPLLIGEEVIAEEYIDKEVGGPPSVEVAEFVLEGHHATSSCAHGKSAKHPWI
jgi:hypothetical protein